MFSVYALSLIQQRTPEHLTGKVMSYVYTISLCAQPVGQMIYGVLFDVFSDSICLVLIPSGILICTAGIMSSGFFRRLENLLSPLVKKSLQQCVQLSAQQDNIHTPIEPEHDKHDRCQTPVHTGKSCKYIQVY